MKFKIALCFLIGSMLASAESISFAFEGYQSSIDTYLMGSGSFYVPNGTVNTDLSSVQGFNMVLYDVQAVPNPVYAFDTYHMDQSDLTQFSASFDSVGNAESLNFETLMMDPANSESNLYAWWTPEGIEPQAAVGGFGVVFNVTSEVAPEPASYGMAIIAGILLVGLGIRRWRNGKEEKCL